MDAGQTAVAEDSLTATAVSITGRADGQMTLLDCARAFARFRSSRVLAAFFVAILAARIVVGQWSWLDLAVAALLVASQPFTEWLIHVFLLHSKPRKLGPVTIDLPTARLHRWHHENPAVLEAVLIPGSLIAASILPVSPRAATTARSGAPTASTTSRTSTTGSASAPMPRIASSAPARTTAPCRSPRP